MCFFPQGKCTLKNGAMLIIIFLGVLQCQRNRFVPGAGFYLFDRRKWLGSHLVAILEVVIVTLGRLAWLVVLLLIRKLDRRQRKRRLQQRGTRVVDWIWRQMSLRRQCGTLLEAQRSSLGRTTSYPTRHQKSYMEDTKRLLCMACRACRCCQVLENVQHLELFSHVFWKGNCLSSTNGRKCDVSANGGSILCKQRFQCEEKHRRLTPKGKRCQNRKGPFPERHLYMHQESQRAWL